MHTQRILKVFCPRCCAEPSSRQQRYPYAPCLGHQPLSAFGSGSGGSSCCPFSADLGVKRTAAECLQEEVLALSGGGDWHMAYLLLYRALTVAEYDPKAPSK